MKLLPILIYPSNQTGSPAQHRPNIPRQANSPLPQMSWDSGRNLREPTLNTARTCKVLMCCRCSEAFNSCKHTWKYLVAGRGVWGCAAGAGRCRWCLVEQELSALTDCEPPALDCKSIQSCWSEGQKERKDWTSLKEFHNLNSVWNHRSRSGTCVFLRRSKVRASQSGQQVSSSRVIRAKANTDPLSYTNRQRSSFQTKEFQWQNTFDVFDIWLLQSISEFKWVKRYEVGKR